MYQNKFKFFVLILKMAIFEGFGENIVGIQIWIFNFSLLQTYKFKLITDAISWPQFKRTHVKQNLGEVQSLCLLDLQK